MQGSVVPTVGPAQCGFTVETRHETVIVCGGELDLVSAPALRAALSAAAGHPGVHVVVDMEQVTFLDGSAITELVRADCELRRDGEDLTVRGLTPAARRVLTLAGVDLTDQPRQHTVRIAKDDETVRTMTIDDVVESWASACSVAQGRPGGLMFPDPAGLVSRIVTVVHDARDEVPPVVLGDSFETSTINDTDPALVVTQLIELGRVLHVSLSDPSDGGRSATRLDSVIGSLVAAALAALVEIGQVDPLTGLLNRRALDHDLEKALAASRRRRQHLTVVMVDVEGLKSVNDRLGHAAGDELLRSVATHLSGTVRAGDRVYRVGGDEFVLVLPDLRPEHIGTMMRRAVSGTTTPFTWGCAWTDGVDDASGDSELAEELLGLADRRMLDFRTRCRSSPDDRVGATDLRTTIDLTEQIAGGTQRLVLVDQATGMLGQHFGAAMADAGEILRSFARTRGETVDVTAELLVQGSVQASEIAVPDLSDPADADGSTLSGTTGGLRGP